MESLPDKEGCSLLRVLQTPVAGRKGVHARREGRYARRLS